MIALTLDSDFQIHPIFSSSGQDRPSVILQKKKGEIFPSKTDQRKNKLTKLGDVIAPK